MIQWRARSRIGIVAIGMLVATCLAEGRACEPAKKTQEWRLLLILKAETDLALKGQPVIKARIPDDNIRAVKTAFFKHSPYWVSNVSEDRLSWKPEVVPVTSASTIGNDTYWLAPWDIPAKINKYALVGRYDGVFVYRKVVNADGKGLNVGFGWSIGPNENANHDQSGLGETRWPVERALAWLRRV